MKNKVSMGLILTLLLMGILTLGFYIQRADGEKPPATEWNKTYGGANSEVARSVIQTSDGGYLLAGQTQSFGAGGTDFWLVKTDSMGNMEWNKTYGGTKNDIAFSVVETSDGGYVLTGRTNSFGLGIADFWLIKVDSSGDHQWNKTYGGTGVDAARCVVQTSDGGYILAGFTESFGAGGQDGWLIKTDSMGNMEWNKTYGGTGVDAARCVVQTSDGGYILAGETNSFGAGDSDFWLIKTDSMGNMEWNKTYGGTKNDVLNSVAKTGDGGYALAGFTESFGAGGQDGWLIKVASPPEYTLTIDSSPVGIAFKVDNKSQKTPWLGTYKQGISVSLEMPEIYAVGDSRYYWNRWSDKDTSRSRTIIMNTNITLTAYYGYPPVANFIWSPSLPKVDEPLIFDASTSLLGWNGTHTMPITEYRWNFGDGNTTTTSTPIVHHSYKTAGNYYVTLTTHAPGATPETNSTTHKVTVFPIPVGGYSIPIKESARTKPLAPYVTIGAILTVALTIVSYKTRRRTARSQEKCS